VGQGFKGIFLGRTNKIVQKQGSSPATNRNPQVFHAMWQFVALRA
jgi:hypothetical protein